MMYSNDELSNLRDEANEDGAFTIIARQVQDNVPVWNLSCDFGIGIREDVGCATCFPREGYMATVSYSGAKATVTGATLIQCVAFAEAALMDIVYGDCGDDGEEDETIARMRQSENEAERYAERDLDWGYGL